MSELGVRPEELQAAAAAARAAGADLAAYVGRAQSLLAGVPGCDPAFVAALDHVRQRWDLVGRDLVHALQAADSALAGAATSYLLVDHRLAGRAE